MDEQALLIALPLRHLEAALAAGTEAVTLPAGGPGDLDAATPGLPVLVMAVDAGDGEVAAATWGATFARRVPYDVGSPWPAGLLASWVEEHPVPDAPAAPDDLDDDLDDEDDVDDVDELDDELDDEDDLTQSFLEVTGLRPLPRDEWLFANELVGKQARGGRSYRPRVPVVVTLPD